ncbi:hypothetical protein ACPA9J_27995 [Pseudomonas aeruginosa]
MQPQMIPRCLLAARWPACFDPQCVCLDLEATLRRADAGAVAAAEGDEGRDVAVSPSQLLHGVRLDAWREALAASPLRWRWSTSAQAIEPRRETATSPPVALRPASLPASLLAAFEVGVPGLLRERLGPARRLAADLAPRLARAVRAGARRKTAGASCDAGEAGPHAWRSAAISSLITGGPGTGRATTVVRLRSAGHRRRRRPTGAHRLAAPTRQGRGASLRVRQPGPGTAGRRRVAGDPRRGHYPATVCSAAVRIPALRLPG